MPASQTRAEWVARIGCCPVCGDTPYRMRERGPNGYSVCHNGHRTRSSDWMRNPVGDAEVIMRVCTLGGLGAVAQPIPPSPQPYFAASESRSLFMPPVGRGMGGLRGVLDDIPMPAKHLALGLSAFALGYWLRGRKKSR